MLDACGFTPRNRVGPIARFDSRISASAEAEVENAAQRVCRAISASKSSLSKTLYRNNSLRRNFDHDCVLFVQHPSKNALHHALRSGSFVACAFPIGNCERATEGGIPKSSRLGRSLKSLAQAGVSDGAIRLSDGSKGLGDQPPGCFTQRIRNLPY